MPPRVDGTSVAQTFDLGSGVSDSPVATVRLGENTLAQVAQRLGLDSGALLQANPQIADPNQLMVGQDIRLPVCQAQSPAQTNTGALPPDKGSESVLASEDSAMAALMAKIQLGGGGHATASPAGPVRFAGPPKQHEKWLGELARDPGEAHKAWKNLGPKDRAAVLQQMEGNYGKDFARQFRDLANSGKGKPGLTTYGTSPSSNFPMTTAAQLTAQGYKKAYTKSTTGLELEFWVHPSGKTVELEVNNSLPGSGQVTPAPTGTPSPSQGPEKPTEVTEDPLAEKQDKAEVQLSRLEDLNAQMKQLLQSKNVPWDEVVKKFHQAQDAYSNLRDLGAVTDDGSAPPLDMSDVDDSFTERLSAADQDLLDIRTEADNRNAEFSNILAQPYHTDDWTPVPQ